MKFIKIALVLLSTFIMAGCEGMPIFQTDPTIPVVNTVDMNLPTKTKWVFQTSTPEYMTTPKPVIPTFFPITGWQKIETDVYEIYLPGGYEGGSTDENVEQIIENLRKMGGEYKWVADNLEQNPDAYELIATDSKKGSSGFITSIQIQQEFALPAYSIEAAMTTETAGLPSNFTIVGEKKTVINGYETGQLIIEVKINNLSAKELLYIIKGENSVWKILFATGADEYDARIVEFVQIIDSFRIKPVTSNE
jgi:hypothetical protein